jgi:hypothetical protein
MLKHSMISVRKQCTYSKRSISMQRAMETE